MIKWTFFLRTPNVLPPMSVYQHNIIARFVWMTENGSGWGRCIQSSEKKMLQALRVYAMMSRGQNRQAWDYLKEKMAQMPLGAAWLILEQRNKIIFNQNDIEYKIIIESCHTWFQPDKNKLMSSPSHRGWTPEAASSSSPSHHHRLWLSFYWEDSSLRQNIPDRV